MTDLNHKLKLETEINTLKKQILNTNSRLDITKVNCLLSKYIRLYGNENRELKNKNSLSIEETNKLESDFYEFHRYKESEAYAKNKEAYNNQIEISKWVTNERKHSGDVMGLDDLSLEVKLGSVEDIIGTLNFKLEVRANGESTINVYAFDPSDLRKSGVLLSLDENMYQKLKIVIEKTDATIEKLKASGQMLRLTKR